MKGLKGTKTNRSKELECNIQNIEQPLPWQVFKHHHVYQAWSTIPSTSVTGVDEQSEAVVEVSTDYST